MQTEARSSAQVTFRIRCTPSFLCLVLPENVRCVGVNWGMAVSGRTHAMVSPHKGPIYAAEETHMLINWY